jgi:hypothetical protein
MEQYELVEGIQTIRRNAIHRSDEKLLRHLRDHIGDVKKLPSTIPEPEVKGKCVERSTPAPPKREVWVKVGIVLCLIALFVLLCFLGYALFNHQQSTDTTVIERTIVNQPIVTEEKPIIQQTFIDNSTTVNSVVKHELPSQVVGECFTINNDTSVVNCNGKIYHLR